METVQHSKMGQMRIAILVVKLPYPPVGGGDLRNYQHIKALEKLGKVRVFCLENPHAELKCRQHKLPDYRVITPGRQLRLVRYIGRVSDRLRRMIADMDGRRIHRLMRKKVASELAAFGPDLIVLEEHKWAPFLPRVRTKLIYDAHNVESVLRERLAERLPATALVDGYHTLEDVRRIERDLANRSAQVWVCSKPDLRLFQDLYGRDKDVRLVPNCIDVENYIEIFKSRLRKMPSFDISAGPTLLYSGVMDYKPNVDAASYFISDIMPFIKEHFPNVRLVLCGRNPTKAMVEAAAHDKMIIVTGEVPDIRPYFEQCDIVVVPLRQGSGTRLKILEALAMGCPVVSTSKGAEGLDVIDGEHLLIADTPVDFARQVERCVRDSALMEKMMISGQELVQQSYSGGVAQRSVIASVRSLHHET